MKEEVQVLPAELAQIANGVSVEKRNEVQAVLNQVFSGVSKMREHLDSIVVADENDKINMKLANTIRLGVKETRLNAEKVFDAKRDNVQQQMLSYKTEDQLWLKSKQTMQILTKEIEEQARWKEETRKRFDAEMYELKVKEREIAIHKFAPEILRSEFESLSDETFAILLYGVEKEYNDRIEAEKKAEDERIEAEKIKAEAIEKQRLENERLKEEAVAREKEIEKEKEKQAKILAKQKADADAREKELQAEKEKQARLLEKEKADAIASALKIKEENDAKLKKEFYARVKLEKELQDKKDAETKAENERIEAKRLADLEVERLAKAPIKHRLGVWVDSFEINRSYIESDDKSIMDAHSKIIETFDKFKVWAQKEIEKL